jgi:hypothetical protein
MGDAGRRRVDAAEELRGDRLPRAQVLGRRALERRRAERGSVKGGAMLAVVTKRELRSVFADAVTWTLGKPDLIVSSPTVFVPAAVSDWSGPVGRTTTGLTEDRYARSRIQEASGNAPCKSPRAPGLSGPFAIHYMNLHHDNSVDEDGNVVEQEGGEGRAVGSLRENIPKPRSRQERRQSIQKRPVSSRRGRRSSGTGTSMRGACRPRRRTRLDLGFRFQPKGHKPSATSRLHVRA